MNLAMNEKIADFVVPVTVWLLIISITDIRKRRIPVWMLMAGGILAAAAVWSQWNGDWQELILGMLPGGVFLGIAFGTKMVGYGDGVVLLLLGMLSGIGSSLIVVGAALCMAAVCSLILLILKKAGRYTRIP